MMESFPHHTSSPLAAANTFSRTAAVRSACATLGADADRHAPCTQSLLDLPDELLVCVATFLPEEDICTLMATCKSLYSLFSLDSLWRERFQLYARTFTHNADFGTNNSPSWRLLTVMDAELQDHLYYSVDQAGQRGFHSELKHPDLAVSHLPGRWREALCALLDRRCATCRGYCGTFHVLLMVRVCDRCAQELHRYAVLPGERLQTFISSLPAATTAPGTDEHSKSTTATNTSTTTSLIPSPNNTAAEELSRLPKRPVAGQGGSDAAEVNHGASTYTTPRSYVSWKHVVSVLARHGLDNLQLSPFLMSGRFALAHVGYFVNPFAAMCAGASYQKYVLDTITDSIGGARSAQLRYHWNGVQSAVECRCGVQGPAAAMQDHYEIVHCRKPWQGPLSPDSMRMGVCLDEQQQRDYMTRRLQHYVDNAPLTAEELPHILATARSVQPLSHWEESVATYETEMGGRSLSTVGEIHGTFIMHGKRRLLCWYRIENEDTVDASAIVSELVACPMSSPTHPSQIGTRIQCTIRGSDGMEVRTRATERELVKMMRVLGLDSSVRPQTFYDLLVSCCLEQIPTRAATTVVHVASTIPGSAITAPAACTSPVSAPCSQRCGSGHGHNHAHLHTAGAAAAMIASTPVPSTQGAASSPVASSSMATTTTAGSNSSADPPHKIKRTSY